jgi:hypothetical protein
MGHSQQLLDVRKNGAFILNDTLLVDYRQQNLAELLNELASQQNRLESLVRRALADDQRLLGQEKANIVSVLQVIVRGLVTLYFKLYDPDHAADFPKDIEVMDAKDGFMIKGKMNPAEVNVKFSIEHWVKEYLENAVESLIADFQAAAKDHKISLAEKVQLIGKIGVLLTQSIQAFYLMRTGAVFK